ncbi:hypothetical protein [Stieleria tagensis]|uniref:hypothetical protein n=1 Tax=Stieleria tagensis TaxID=2956795 RepID=UPI00209AD378|nr:hypothetical protein [Stieleria tagensis]
MALNVFWLCLLVTTGVLVSTGVGCTSVNGWSDRGDENNAAPDLPLRKIARNIELDARFVQIQFDPNDPDQLQSLWQWVDETVLPSATRTVLQQNGMRIGKAIQTDRMTQKLETLKTKETTDVVEQFLASAAVSSHQSEGSRLIPMRIGKRYELPVRLPIEGDHVVMVNQTPQPVGRTLRDPQFLFAVTPQNGDSSAEVRIRFRPEIQHGEMRQDWVKGDGALRIDVRRQSWSLDSLDFEIRGHEGDVFVIAETADRKGLGKEMLGGKNVDQMEQQTVVLLKIANVPTPAERL